MTTAVLQSCAGANRCTASSLERSRASFRMTNRCSKERSNRPFLRCDRVLGCGCWSSVEDMAGCRTLGGRGPMILMARSDRGLKILGAVPRRGAMC